jgi:uncharacterized protein YbaR (Trm112 family)/SAM-dependent methyltransferase
MVMMREALLDLLRCPFCGSRLTVVENEALTRTGDRLESGVLGCDCCAFPIVAGIPVMIADDTTRNAMHQMEAGQGDEALFTLLGLDDVRGASFRALFERDGPATYRDALNILSLDAEGTCFLYRLSDPTYLTTQAVLRGIGLNRWTVSRPVLDLCGGSGHLTRVLAGLQPTGGTVLADLFFWKLWLAKRFTSPECEPICCDANSPLPFARDTFSLAVLADAFPYIWHKRLLAEEMMRLVGPEGVIVMPHLHSSLGENFSAGMTLSPAAYQDLFAPQQPRLFGDQTLFQQVLERRTVDLTLDVTPADLGTEPSFTLIASRRADLFRKYDVPDALNVGGELKVNPLYVVERRGDTSILTLKFPTPEYEEEFGACKQYLPDMVTVRADLTGSILPAALGADYEELRRRRVIIDVPVNYC